MYTTQEYTASLDIDKYLEEYVSIEEFLECCKACGNYGTKWSCPPYDFDVKAYWRQFKRIFVIGVKISFDEDMRQRTYEKKELDEIMSSVLGSEKAKLSEKLYELEEAYPGSVSLSAGSCGMCGGEMVRNHGECTRVASGEVCQPIEGVTESALARKYCRHYDKMRYSIESIGGNVGKTCSKLLGLELEWAEENKLPGHFVLVSALLCKDSWPADGDLSGRSGLAASDNSGLSGLDKDSLRDRIAMDGGSNIDSLEADGLELDSLEEDVRAEWYNLITSIAI